MKRMLFLLLCLCTTSVLNYAQAQVAQQARVKKKYKETLDYRIDNMGYWMDKAEKGLVPFNPTIPIKPAIDHGHKISNKNIKTVNSIDIPVADVNTSCETENSIFVDPNDFDHVLNSNNSADWNGSSATNRYGANYLESFSGGQIWSGSIMGLGNDQDNIGDPAAVINQNGRRFINYIEESSSGGIYYNGGQNISYSDDGNTWTEVVIEPEPGFVADKNHMWVDNSLTSPFKDNLYVAWSNLGMGETGEIMLTRSTNNGLNWATPFSISSAVNATNFNHGVNLQTGPAGNVYATWAIYDNNYTIDEDALGFAKSTDGGATFEPALRAIDNISGIRYSGTLKYHRVNSFPVMAVDNSNGPYRGSIYIVWANRGYPQLNTGSNISIYITKSTDDGETWTLPVRVNQGPDIDGKEAYFPWISCDTETGILSVIFYDDRNTDINSCEVFVSSSFDGGDSWDDFVVSDVSFTPSPIPGYSNQYMGDYLGITSLGGKVYPCWTDNRNGFMTYVSPFEYGLSAEFAATNTQVCKGNSTIFHDVSSGGPISWSWDFPGGSPSTYNGKTPPPVSYFASGNYSATLTIFDGVEYKTNTKTNYIEVKDVFAGFDADNPNINEGESVVFSDNSLCATSWAWSFPGGTPSNYIGQNPPAIFYNTDGPYDVSLTATNPQGSDTKTLSNYIHVYADGYKMINGTAFTCGGSFYDSGEAVGDYNNNEDFEMTFFASSPGYQIEFDFTEFEVGSYTIGDCWDYLEIFNGVGTSSTLIGSYNCTDSPGLVSSSNTDGALTFRFNSNTNNTYPGWVANINCKAEPIDADFSASNLHPSQTSTVTFNDLSSGGTATSWAWSFNPSSVSFMYGTDANSQNPKVKFNESGYYTVSLSATNGWGTNVEVKTNYIEVVSCTYCTSGFSDPMQFYVSNVTFGNINNSSTGGGYQDFASLSTDVDVSGTYNISLSLVNNLGQTTANCYAFIDWDHSCNFETDEIIWLGEFQFNINGTGVLNSTISVPSDALAGQTRMRVINNFNSYSNPCYNGYWGETEDYSINVNASQGGSYCDINYSNTSDDWISNVSLNTINNTSGSVGYENYTNLSTELAMGQTYTLSVEVTVNGSWAQHVWAWVDWNNDSDFDDTNEAIDLGQTPGSAGTFTLSTNLNVPSSGIILGGKRLRVAEQYAIEPLPCGSFAYGEAEDYTIDVVAEGPCSPCATNYTNTTDDWISNVNLKSINNSSGTGGYQDFTFISTDCSEGITYTLSVNIQVNGNWEQHCIAWIDWNQDCDFEDMNESFDLGNTPGTEGGFTLSTTVSVPAGTALGERRMRIAENNASNPMACGTFTYGEAEDYTINVVEAIPVDLALTVFLEGPINGTQMYAGVLASYGMPLSQPFNTAPWNYYGSETVASFPSDVVDWLLIELRDASSAANATTATTISRQAAFVTQNGQLIGMAGNSILNFGVVVSDNLYVVVYHRNHLAIMSNFEVTQTGGLFEYNFSNSSDKAYGGIYGQKEIYSGVWGMFAGDGDKDGAVGNFDKSLIWANETGNEGYIQSDYNADGQADNLDKNKKWYPNKGEISQVPN